MGPLESGSEVSREVTLRVVFARAERVAPGVIRPHREDVPGSTVVRPSLAEVAAFSPTGTEGERRRVQSRRGGQLVRASVQLPRGQLPVYVSKGMEVTSDTGWLPTSRRSRPYRRVERPRQAVSAGFSALDFAQRREVALARRAFSGGEQAMRAFVRDHVGLDAKHWAVVAEVMFTNPGWQQARRPLPYLHVAARREIGRRRRQDFLGPRDASGGSLVGLMATSELELIRPATPVDNIGYIELLEDVRWRAKLTEEETAVLGARGFGTTSEVPELLGISPKDHERLRKRIDRKLLRTGLRGRRTRGGRKA